MRLHANIALRAGNDEWIETIHTLHPKDEEERTKAKRLVNENHPGLDKNARRNLSYARSLYAERKGPRRDSERFRRYSFDLDSTGSQASSDFDSHTLSTGIQQDY